MPLSSDRATPGRKGQHAWTLTASTRLPDSSRRLAPVAACSEDSSRGFPLCSRVSARTPDAARTGRRNPSRLPPNAQSSTASVSSTAIAAPAALAVTEPVATDACASVAALSANPREPAVPMVRFAAADAPISRPVPIIAAPAALPARGAKSAQAASARPDHHADPALIADTRHERSSRRHWRGARASRDINPPGRGSCSGGHRKPAVESALIHVQPTLPERNQACRTPMPKFTTLPSSGRPSGNAVHTPDAHC
jgi:hypothetical protein